MVGVDALSACSTEIAKILQKALEDREVSVEDGERLFTVTGAEYDATVEVANELRRRVSPDRVTYVVNRNINFTNVCVKRCGFCAFSRGHRAEEGYYLPIEEIVRRAKEAWDSRSDRGVRPGRTPTAHEGFPLHRSLSRHQDGTPGHSHSWILAGGGAVWRRTIRMQCRRVSNRLERSGCRIAARNVGRDSERSRPGLDFSRPDHNGRLETSHSYGPLAGDPNDIDDHVRPFGNSPGLRRTHRAHP